MRAAKQSALRDPAAEISPFGHRADHSRASAHAARRSALLCATPRFVVREQFVFYNSRIVLQKKMKTIDFILDGKFHLHTPKKRKGLGQSKVTLKKKVHFLATPPFS